MQNILGMHQKMQEQLKQDEDHGKEYTQIYIMVSVMQYSDFM